MKHVIEKQINDLVGQYVNEMEQSCIEHISRHTIFAATEQRRVEENVNYVDAFSDFETFKAYFKGHKSAFIEKGFDLAIPYFVDVAGANESNWSGGFSVTNMLEQVRRKVSLKFATKTQLYQYMDKIEEQVYKLAWDNVFYVKGVDH